MSRSLESELDRILDTRRQRGLQRKAELADLQKAIDYANAEPKLKQNKFHNEVRLLIRQTFGQANTHLGKDRNAASSVTCQGSMPPLILKAWEHAIPSHMNYGRSDR